MWEDIRTDWHTVKLPCLQFVCLCVSSWLNVLQRSFWMELPPRPNWLWCELIIRVSVVKEAQRQHFKQPTTNWPLNNRPTTVQQPSNNQSTTNSNQHPLQDFDLPLVLPVVLPVSLSLSEWLSLYLRAGSDGQVLTANHIWLFSLFLPGGAAAADRSDSAHVNCLKSAAGRHLSKSPSPGNNDELWESSLHSET